MTIMKRGQGLPLNTIIVAIIVVVVLVVIILIFTGQIGGVNTSLNSCMRAGGYCSADCGTLTDTLDYLDEYSNGNNNGCEDPTPECCIGV